MKEVRISDRTLCQTETVFSFKEKLEIARYLDKLNVDQIELPKIVNEKTDALLIKTMASFIRNARISVGADPEGESLKAAVEVLAPIENAAVRIEVPVSPVGMEYTARKKAPKLLEAVKAGIKTAKDAGLYVELCAADATRAEEAFLKQLLAEAKEAGADLATFCDDAAEMLPDRLAQFAASFVNGIPVGIAVNNKNGLACAGAILCVGAGADVVKTSVVGSDVPLETFATILKNCGNTNGFSSRISYTDLNKTIRQIGWVTDNNGNETSVVTVSNTDEAGISLNRDSDREEVNAAISKLGYDLSLEDQENVYEAFHQIAGKKNVDAHELDAIIASVALEVPQTYKLVSYVVNNGNIISTSAQIAISRDGRILQGIELGDGPVDASFLAIEKIIGHHYELDDFQIQAISEGKEALGQTVVKLRNNGKLYSGKGISADIIGASIKAYISAVNKIIYEEGSAARG